MSLYNISSISNRYSCPATGGNNDLLTWAEFVPAAGVYTHPEKPTVTVTTTNTVINIAITNPNQATTGGAAEYYAQHWQGCSSCRVPFNFGGQKRYECVWDNIILSMFKIFGEGH